MAMAKSPRLKSLAKHVKFVPTRDGMRIDLVDDADFSMFLLGTTVLTPDAAELLRAIGQAVAGTVGHDEARVPLAGERIEGRHLPARSRNAVAQDDRIAERITVLGPGQSPPVRQKHAALVHAGTMT